MHLDKINLTAGQLAALYNTKLVEEIDTRPQNLEMPPKYVSDAQNKNKSVAALVIFNESGGGPLSPEADVFLNNMLAACRLNNEDFTVFNIGHQPIADYLTVIENHPTEIVLLFDVSPTEFGLPVSFPQYQQQAIAGIQVIYFPALTFIKEDKSEKLKVWNSLKKIFKLS